MNGFGHRALILCFHLLAATFIIGGMTFAAETEAHWFPVVREVQIEQAYMQDGNLHVSGSFEKVRGYCSLKDSSIFMEVDGTLIAAERLDMPKPISRPEGKQVFGEWVIKDYIEGSELVISMVHRCHPMWYTDSIFYKGNPL